MHTDTAIQPRVSRSETIARKLQEEILEGGLEPGTRLGTKQQLRDRFGVAVATVNEAIRLLETSGLVEARPGPGGGVFVSSPPTDVRLSHLVLRVRSMRSDIEDTLAVRNALEELVCQEAARRAGERELVELDALVDRMAEVADDPRAFLQANWALHRRIAEIGHNQPLLNVYLTLLDVVESHLEEVRPDAVFRASQNVAVHRQLVAAIASRDRAKIARAVKRHAPVAQVEPVA